MKVAEDTLVSLKRPIRSNLMKSSISTVSAFSPLGHQTCMFVDRRMVVDYFL